MTRTDSARHAAATTKESVRHAAEVVAPYVGTAKDTAAHYADEARRRISPKVAAAAGQAKDTALAQYDSYVAPRVAQAKDAVPPKVAATTATAARRTRAAAQQAAQQAADYTAPRVNQAVDSARSAAEPVREEAVARAGAALAALRGQVSAAEVEKLVRKHQRRGRVGRFAKRTLVLGALAGAGFAAWRWWSKQTNPDWLVEAPSATEPLEDEARSVPGDTELDPEVRRKQAEEAAHRAEGGED
ncbi:DUF5324 family protein [Streptomyces sp. PTM05]|uniref:DUF5324 family protein n=1 Tax=Streptantibioticus parmotrematis TaxID=2873249 RepID=A0ABS7QY28_9ACTN|nr:DUF5324 family protein [Streptantibioticus parmotrematis]MBY8888115.1 DUF5324 family protein [Streptantibioticus parmotrematis]